MNELRVKGLDDIVPEMLRAVALRCDGRYAEALACYDRIRAINPRFIVCLVDQALLLAEMGRFENALDSIDEFRRHSPAITEVEDCRATIVDRAIAELSSSIDRRPGDSRLLTQRAGVYARCGELNLARADFERSVASDSSNVAALNGLANTYLAQSQLVEAAVAYRRALAVAPENPDVWFNLGNVLQQMGDLTEACVAYQTAINYRPDFAVAHLEIAHCLLSEGRYREGWYQFEWRWQTPFMRLAAIETDRPRWRNDSSAAAVGGYPANVCDKTLLVWAEQGAWRQPAICPLSSRGGRSGCSGDRACPAGAGRLVGEPGRSADYRDD